METVQLNKFKFKSKAKKVLEMLENLDEIDDVQNIFINCEV